MPLEVLAIPLGASIAVFGSITLVVHALGTLLTHASQMKRYSAKQLLVALLAVFTGSLGAAGRVVTRVLYGLVQWWVFFLVIFLAFSVVNVTFTEYPSIWTGAVRAYNRNVGPWMHYTVVIPLKVVDVLLRGLIPLWDTVIWFIKAVGLQGLLPLVIKEIATVLKMATALVDLVRNLSMALFWFVESFFCEGVQCLHPEKGVMDLLSSMGNVREFVALGTQLGQNFCGTLAAPVDLILYPFLDLNLAEAVHNVVNAVTQLVVVIPRATTVRCALKAGDRFDLLMCTPDMAPFFHFLAAGMSSIGLAFDNWANIALVIVQEFLTGERPSCGPTASGLFPDLLANRSLFPGSAAPIAVVGLTDWLYSVTDGRMAYYLAQNDGMKTKVQAWPHPVDTELGVAAVTYSKVHDLDVSAFSTGKTSGSMQTTAMLGCNCSDAPSGMVILCAILPMSGIPSEAGKDDYLLQVLFPTTAAASMYTCAGVDLYVKSIRWSFTRYETTDASLGSSGDRATLPTHDCIARGTCRELDAVVWLVPRCGQDESRNAETACLESAPCMPFCMAARTAGGGRENLVLTGARRWREGTTILGRDCALEDSTPGAINAGMPVAPKSLTRAAASMAGILQAGGVGVHGSSSTPDPVCKRAERMTSVITKEESVRTRVAANVRRFSQPFAITGDTILSAVDLGGDAHAVQVERLEGSEVDVFSLNAINQQLPALPKAVVQLTTADQEAQDRLTIPFNYGTNRLAAVNSRNYVFYASSPNADALGAYFQYCADLENPDKISKFGILLKSSYARIRIYRVSAYRRCAAYSCGQDLVKFTEIEGFSGNFARACDEIFNASVQALEYLNEDNIAVTVQAAHVRSYDERRGTFRYGGNTSSRTYWLNPTTMRLKTTIWETSVPSSSRVVLCPSMQRLPRIGSFAMEVVNAGVFLFKSATNAVLYTPGLISMWRRSQACAPPGSSLYHPMLSNCGEEAYSLDDFFDSVDDAASIFWHSLSLIGTLIAPDRPAIGEPITRVMEGMSQYGQGTVDLWAARASVLTLTRLPVRDQMAQMWVAVQSGLERGGPGMMQGLSAGGAGIVAWSRYSYRLVSVIAISITKRALDPAVDLNAARVFHLIWGHLYDLQDEFDATVTDRMRLGCAGLKLMFGAGNPWADFVYQHCSSGAELTRSLMRTVLNIFVQIPMAKCVCRDSAGQPLAAFATAQCAPILPVSLLPTLYMIVNEVMADSAGAQYANLACPRVLERVKTEISGSMDSWFDHQYKAMDALSSSVDYMTSSFDDKAGRCLDFQNDPHVTVIVPQPVDYFQRCAGTSRCKQICSKEWGAFQDSLAASRVKSAPPTPIPVLMESLFFPGEIDSSLMMRNAVASVELPRSAAGGKCLARAKADLEDYALAVAEVEADELRVTFWCAPLMAHSPVYRSESAGFTVTMVGGSPSTVQFGDDTGEWLAVLVQLASGGQAVYVASRASGWRPTPALADLMDEAHVLMRVENMWVIEGAVLVDLVTRHMTSSRDRDTGQQSARSSSEAVHALFRPTGGNQTWNRMWVRTATNLMQFGGGQYWYTKLPGSADPYYKQPYLFLPRVAGMLPHKIWFVAVLGQMSMDPPEPILRPARLSMLEGTTLSARSQNPSYVFATSRVGWDWLKQVRLAASGAYIEGVFESANIEVTVQVQGNCNDRSCEGCPNVQAQRLCLAYNKCALVNCVGTPVHQRRPLCGIGALLRHNGGMGLRSAQGAWMIFTEMLGLTMQLSLMTMKEARLLWPEDAFLCYVCQAKDRSAEFFSILTATVNSALQLSDASVGFMYGGASNVDSNADAVLTISSNALNGFLHQVTLAPLYALVVMHQTVMCQVSGVIALMDGTGFTLSLKPADESSASDIIAGQCLTLGAQTLASYPADSPTSLGITVTSLAANAIQRLFLMQIEPFLHVIDGMLAYIIGVVKSLGVLIMAQNTARCNPPDFSLKDVVHCACGDHRLRIPATRRTEGVEAGALWCTGVLGMIDSGNQPYYVYNKFTYAELQAMSEGLKNYTECVSSTAGGGYKCPVPSDPWFQAQGVSTFNVLVKCRENFVKKRWDPAAYMLYQTKYWDLLRLQDGAVPSLPQFDSYGARDCLQDGDASAGTLAQSCLQEYLLRRDMSEDEYWMYERTDATLPGPEYTDACLVFSGPAEVQNIEQFAACVDGLGSGCSLPQHLWTPLSDNSIPSAEQHRVASYGTNQDGLVQHLYSRAQAMVERAVNRSLQVWGEGQTGTDAVDVEFFSVEGDVLHQTMDCIFMGPYSRIDYWPTPVCEQGEECLRGPFWSRDEDEGLGRFVDPKSCSAPTTLPYTCGSPARKSLMRYLVKTILAGGMGGRNQNVSTVQRILRETLLGLRADWADRSRFGCDCSPGGNATGAFSPSCCRNFTGRPLLPPALNRTFTSVNSSTVLQALQAGMEELFEQALENQNVWLAYMADVAPEEWMRYNWSGSTRVEDEARYDPIEPVRSYSSATEAMSPLKEVDSTLWDVCHAALKQVFFTLPVGDTGILDEDREGLGDFDGDPARLEAFVKRFTSQAFDKSPLFRHYSPRHAPSESQMCEQSSPGPADEGSVTYTDFVQAGMVLMRGDELSTSVPVFHAQRFRVGASGRTCLCGWQRVGDACIVPVRQGTRDSVCSSGLVHCLGTGERPYNLSQQDALELQFSPAWFCPEFELSPHWGFLDNVANEEWLAKNATHLLASSRDLLHHGRAGLRAANLDGLSELGKARVNPTTRVIPLERGRLTTCAPRPPGDDLVGAFVDNLFPAAQAVEEPGALAYCLRYAIEVARLQVLNLLKEEQLVGERAQQRERTGVWRRRCGTQLHLLHMCSSMNVYRPLVLAREGVSPACPHFRLVGVPRAGAVVYVTPQCLVSIDGVFYDPCRCMPCTGQATSILNWTAILGPGTARCRLRFDPREIVQLGHPIGWTDGIDPLEGDPARLLLTDFARKVWDDPDAAGNARADAGAWWAAEGPMTENSEFCDGVLDWWPEDWSFPVGYHVTVPCEAEDTAYRSFAQAFALADGDRLVYQHDLLRDAELADSHFGVGGLCRSSNFGMPMPETNNVRYCTRMQVDDTEDFTLPVQNGDDPTDTAGAWGEERCSDSSAELPWPSMTSQQDQVLYQTSRFSVGTVPNMPPQHATTYPASESEVFNIGPWQEIGPEGRSWWQAADQLCQDFTLRTCQTDTDCPHGGGFACRGRVCEGDKTRACTASTECTGAGRCLGVCVDTAQIECIMHRECPGDQMCSGVGTCEPAVIAVQNRLEESGNDISFNLAVNGTGCGDPTVSRSFSLLGSSYWGNTDQDLLRAHGMCSFEDWYKYTQSYSQAGCSTPQADGTLRANPSQCTVMDLEQIATNQTRWWPAGKNRPELMYLRPTKCDRDYERLQGFTQCAPVSGAGTFLLQDDERRTNQLGYDRFVRLHEDRTSMRMAVMPERAALSTGFLGMGGRVASIDDLQETRDPGPFVSCASVGQCYPSDFFVNGVNRGTNRSYFDERAQAWRPYPVRSPFVCGVFGVESSTGQGCQLELDVLPLYRFLCIERLPSCRGLDEVRMDRACNSITREYQPSMQDRDRVLRSLRDLFEVFPTFQDIEMYLSVTSCAADLYTRITARASWAASAGIRVSNGLYFPFMFTLYEFPFDWFYQCILLTGTRVNVAARNSQDCRPFVTRASHTIDDYQPLSPATGDSSITYLQFLKGGYTWNDVLAYETTHRNAALGVLNNAKQAVRGGLFPDTENDLTFPRCSTRLLWRIGRYGNAWETEGIIEAKRAIIWNWHDPQSCKLSWHARLIRGVQSYGITETNWDTELTYPERVNLVPQQGVGAATMLKTIETFISDNLLTVPVEGILNSDSMRGCLRFNNRPPPAYDFLSHPVPEALIPKEAPGGAGVTDMDETVARTCVFPPVFDPAFIDSLASTPGCGATEDVIVSGSRTDSLRRCGDLMCTSVPVAFKRKGRFDCRYQAEGNIPACSQDNPGCHTALLSHLYDRVVLEIVDKIPPPPEILRPTLFEWFRREEHWTFDSFRLDGVLDYERNIQPNPERTVMCEITTTAENAIRYTTCNNPHYLTLKQHAERHYKRDGSVVVPAGQQLEWPVGRAMLASGVILAFSNMNKSINRRYMDALFDDNTVCKNEPNLQVCRKENATRFRSINPWMLGRFNPYEVCDVDFTDQGEGGREYIYSYCIKEGNEPACAPFRERQVPTKCSLDHMRFVTRPGVTRAIQGHFFRYNLCFHRLEEDSEECMHDQGLLGGYDGLPVGANVETAQSMLEGWPYDGAETYRVATNLYENSTWSIPDDFKRSFFEGGNPLWHGGEAPYGHLQIKETDIGGHRIGLVVSRINDTADSFSEMNVRQVSLGVREDYRLIGSVLNPDRGLPAAGWVPGLREDMQAEDAEMRELYDLTFRASDLSVSCPLKRWMFYSGNKPNFSPTIPSAQRARHLFHRIHGGLIAHPTMRRTDPARFLGNYTTSNGFCACPAVPDIHQSQCQVSVAALDTTACSLAQTIQSLRAADETLFFSHVHVPIDNDQAQRRCRMSLDWPGVDGVLRDGSPLSVTWEKASSQTGKLCHVLDRFRPFQYRYRTAPSLKDGLDRNTVTHGACQTARVVSLDPSVLPRGFSRCLRRTTSQTHARFTCNTTSPAATDPYAPQMPRRTRLTVDELLRRRSERRSWCSKCAPPPRFTSQDGAPIPPESSFGRLHRWSTERMLAKDLRDALCGGTAGGCQMQLNQSAWKRGQFMHNLLFAPHLLLANATPPSPRSTGATPEDPGRWTAKPWVYCPTPESLRTGEGCQGVITRAEWARSRTRICPRMVRSFSTTATNTTDGDPMARTPFCSIDNTTDEVCLAIAEARQLVIQANCIARGNLSCMPTPFVYHPASYEPSNNAWTRDSVRAFYLRLNQSSCAAPTASEQQALVDFARQYQRGCPANAVNLMVSILQVVRVVASEVALLVSTLAGMLVKGMGLLLPARAADMRQYIAADWQYVRTKWRTVLDTAGDLMVDAMLNSGELGARIMGFLEQTCARINEALAWFLNVWCNYIQQYMIQVLAGLRYAMGIMGAGFDMLQDFVDEIFQGILPAAFVQKYAQKNFKDTLVEAYSRPTDRRDRVKVENNVPDTANPRPSSQTAKKKNMMSRVTSMIGKVGKSPAGKALGFLGAAFTAYELVSGVMDIIEEEKLRQLWPEDFTLFDLSGVVNAIDDMERFLLMDDSCYEFHLAQKQNLSYTKFQCLSLNLDSYNATTAGTTSLVSTQCWADARPTLGQNSLFACSAASTCCRTSECKEVVLCASCADDVLPGTNKYGCDSLRKTCVCGQARSQYDRCSANRQCSLTSQCELVSTLNSVSYGTIPCANCPATARVMCLLPSSGLPGRCSCMLDSIKGFDLCSDRSGTRTTITGSRLCAYLHGSSPPASWVFDMEDLLMVPCQQVRVGVCSTVMQDGRTIQMVVAESISVSPSTRRRHLLVSDDAEQVVPEPGPPTYDAYESEYELTDSQALHDLLTAPGWNTTAAPCSTLAMAYQERKPLGLLETHVLHKCGFWRYVGRQVIRRYNLTIPLAGHETFLLSMDDMVYALMRPDVAVALLKTPAALANAALYHPWLKPLRAFGVMVANQLEHLQWLRDIDADVHDALFGGEDKFSTESDLRPELQPIQPRFRHAERPRRSHANPPREHDAPPPGVGRHLLSVQESAQAVAQYSAGVIRDPSAANFGPPSVVSGAWATSDFSWPPRYSYPLAACPLATSILQIAMQAVTVNRLYFANFQRPYPPKDRSLRGNLPRWDWVGNITLAGASDGKQSLQSIAYHWLLQVLAIQPGHVVAFFTDDRKWSLQWILQTTVQCDLAAVVTCSRHDKDLIMSTVVFAIIYAGVWAMSRALEVNFMATIFLLSYPWFILWYVFGMAPSCFPMLPPCLIADIIATLEALVPTAMLFPPELLCDSAQRAPLNQTCLRSCSDLGFASWADPLAFAICDTDTRTCEYLQELGPTGEGYFDTLVWDRLRTALANAQRALKQHELDPSAWRVCTWVTFIWVVPALALVVGITVVASAALAFVFDLVPSLATFMAQALVFFES